MIRRFVPVPYDALALCSSAPERLCVLAVYERAHSYGWRALRMSVRAFASAGDLRLESAMRLLEDLEEAGLVSWERGTRTSAGRIAVLDPALKERAEHLEGGAAEHPAEHREEPPDDVYDEERNTDRNTAPPPRRNAPRVNTVARGVNQTTLNHPAENGSLSPAREEEPFEGLHLLELQADAGEPPDDRDRRAIAQALRGGADLEQLERLWWWSGESADTDAEACRRGGWRRWGSMLNTPEAARRRLAQAEAWHKAGRQAKRRPAAPPIEPDEDHATDPCAQAFRLLSACGCRQPADWRQPGRRAAALEVWRQRLGRLSWGQIEAACGTWLASERAQWWPMPGQLLQLVPEAPRLRLVEEEPDPDWLAFGALPEALREVVMAAWDATDEGLVRLTQRVQLRGGPRWQALDEVWRPNVLRELARDGRLLELEDEALVAELEQHPIHAQLALELQQGGAR